MEMFTYGKLINNNTKSFLDYYGRSYFQKYFPLKYPIQANISSNRKQLNDHCGNGKISLSQQSASSEYWNGNDNIPKKI